MSDSALVREKVVREYLRFRVGSASYAVVLHAVREVILAPKATEIPGSAAHVLGVTLLRGRVTTVLDLSMRLQRTQTEPSDKARVLLLSDGAHEVVGGLVDEVLGIVKLEDSLIEPASVLGTHVDAAVTGMARLAEPKNRAALVCLLDPAALLHNESLAAP